MKCRERSLAVHRQFVEKECSLAIGRLEIELATVPLDNRFGNTQTETSAAGQTCIGVVTLREDFEDLFLHLRQDAVAVVAFGSAVALVLKREGEIDLAA